MTREVFEGKYELDSLAAVLKLSNNYYQWTNDTACLRPDWIDAMSLVIDTITVQQQSTVTPPRPAPERSAPPHPTHPAACRTMD